MRKRVINCLMLFLFMVILTNSAIGGEKKYTKILESRERANLSLTEAHDEITISKNEVVRVEEPLKVDKEIEQSDESIEILTRCVEAEAGNQDLLGKRLVCDVILNRVDSPRFPDTIEEVIKQKYHFTTFWDGSMNSIEPSEETNKAVEMELQQRTDSEILFFTAGDYNIFSKPAYKHGDHYFGY